MKLKYFRMLTLALLSGMLLTACDDKDDAFKPGESNPADTPAVLFSTDCDQTYIISGSADTFEAEVTLTRRDTQGALTVPIEVKRADEGLDFAHSVTFADGEAEAQLHITLDHNTAHGVRRYFSLAIPADYTDYYTTVGSAVLNSSMVVVDASSATCYVQNYPTQTGGAFEVEMLLLGTYEYTFPDFLHSGRDLTLTIDPSTWAATPSGSLIDAYDPEYGSWDITTTMYPGPDGVAPATITALYIYNSYTEYYEWSGGNHGIYLNVYIMLSDGTAGYDYMFLRFPEGVGIPSSN